MSFDLADFGRGLLGATTAPPSSPRPFGPVPDNFGIVFVEARAGLPTPDAATLRIFDDRLKAHGYQKDAKNFGAVRCLLAHRHGSDARCIACRDASGSRIWLRCHGSDVEALRSLFLVARASALAGDVAPLCSSCNKQDAEKRKAEKLSGVDDLGGVMATALGVAFLAVVLGLGVAKIEGRRLLDALERGGFRVLPPRTEPPKGWQIVRPTKNEITPIFTEELGSMLGRRVLKFAVDQGWRYAKKAEEEPQAEGTAGISETIEDTADSLKMGWGLCKLCYRAGSILSGTEETEGAPDVGGYRSLEEHGQAPEPAPDDFTTDTASGTLELDPGLGRSEEAAADFADKTADGQKTVAFLAQANGGRKKRARDLVVDLMKAEILIALPGEQIPTGAHMIPATAAPVSYFLLDIPTRPDAGALSLGGAKLWQHTSVTLHGTDEADEAETLEPDPLERKALELAATWNAIDSRLEREPESAERLGRHRARRDLFWNRWRAGQVSSAEEVNEAVGVANEAHAGLTDDTIGALDPNTLNPERAAQDPDAAYNVIAARWTQLLAWLSRAPQSMPEIQGFKSAWEDFQKRWKDADVPALLKVTNPLMLTKSKPVDELEGQARSLAVAEGNAASHGYVVPKLSIDTSGKVTRVDFGQRTGAESPGPTSPGEAAKAPVTVVTAPATPSIETLHPVATAIDKQATAAIQAAKDASKDPLESLKTGGKWAAAGAAALVLLRALIAR